MKDVDLYGPLFRWFKSLSELKVFEFESCEFGLLGEKRLTRSLFELRKVTLENKHCSQSEVRCKMTQESVGQQLRR